MSLGCAVGSLEGAAPAAGSSGRDTAATAIPKPPCHGWLTLAPALVRANSGAVSNEIIEFVETGCASAATITLGSGPAVPFLTTMSQRGTFLAFAAAAENGKTPNVSIGIYQFDPPRLASLPLPPGEWPTSMVVNAAEDTLYVSVEKPFEDQAL